MNHPALVLPRIAVLLFTTIVLISFVACNKGADHQELPPYTETGANTFGCTVNGELFTPQGKALSMYRPLDCDYSIYRDTPHFSIAARDYQNDKAIDIGMNGIWINGDTIVHFAGLRVGSLSAGYESKALGQCETEDSLPGELHIKHFDTVNYIVSGTFWFDARNPETNEIVRVRDGRFDLKY